jgi:hypothetical protein
MRRAGWPLGGTMRRLARTLQTGMVVTMSQPETAGETGVASYPARGWRAAVAFAAMIGGAGVIAGALLPWVEAFAGLIPIAGVRGLNGRILLAAGGIIGAAGLWHLLRADRGSRWLIGLAGSCSLAFAGYLLLRLTALLPAVNSGSMAAVRPGPGLWVIVAGSALAFGTMFLPTSDQRPDHDSAATRTGLAAWAADLESAGRLRWLQCGLGALWLADAGLQCQPHMFSPAFATGTIAPAAMGSPGFVATPVTSYSQLILHSPVAFNAAFAGIQVLLGLGLLWRRSVRAALIASICWAVVVWWVGEGMGMIFAGQASALTGAPGAALLYIALAVLAWPSRPAGRGESLASAGLLRGRGARLMWLALWSSLGYFTLAAGLAARGAVRASLAGQAAGEPAWIASMDRSAADAVGRNGPAVALILAGLFGLIATGMLASAAAKPVAVLALVTATALWVIGENFGGVLTGTGTDPSTGPLLALIAAAFWPLGRRERRASPAPAGIQLSTLDC